MMFKKYLILSITIAFCMTGCDDKLMDADCKPGDTICTNGVLYECSDGVNSSHDKEKYTSHIYWSLAEKCVYQCNEDKTGCQLVENNGNPCETNRNGACKSCIAGWMPDGSCRQIEGCTIGWKANGSCSCNNGLNEDEANNEDGSCKCNIQCEALCGEDGSCPQLECQNGYSPDGTCNCPENCQRGCDESGVCKCPDDCPRNGDLTDQYKCDADGNICCNAKCRYGCNAAGVCLCASECENGCNINGDCCPANCQNGCDAAQQCSCPEYCVTGKCDDDGLCVRDESCKNGWKDDGGCICPSSCEKGCLPNGGCYFPGACTDDKSCKDDPGCKDNDCYCDKVCKYIDANNNHMHDKHESGEKLGASCRVDDNCGKDGFCDSAVGYRCTTRCTDSKQCLDGYECRADGRCAPKEFVTVWRFDKDNKTLVLPVGTNCVFKVNWGDGTSDDIDSCSSPKMSHTYTEADEYTVKISGQYDGFAFCSYTGTNGNESIVVLSKNYNNLIKIESFGPVGLGPFAFCNVDNLSQISTVDIPDASKMTNMRGMFHGSNFNVNIENWDVSQVTGMHGVFQYNSSFNQPLDKWNVSRVTTMRAMFSGASKFNQPLDSWDVTNVTDMYHMFCQASSFNGNISSWNPKNVTSFQSMFNLAHNFNQNISKWDVSSATNMIHMFAGAYSFNQPLNDWNVSKVKTMAGMFKKALKFNYPLDKWNVGEVTDMSEMFAGTPSFNQPLNTWDVSKVTTMKCMFDNAGVGNDKSVLYGKVSKFNQPLNKWRVSNVKNMEYMFRLAKAFNQDLSGWTVTAGTKADGMFNYSGLSDNNYCKIKKSASWKTTPGITRKPQCKP